MNCKLKTKRKNEHITFRATAGELLLLAQAVEVTGQKRSSLLRQAAMQVATEALAISCQ